MRHTLGPWRIVDHNWSDTGIFADDCCIARLTLDEEDYADSEEGRELAEGYMLQQQANANLIAAAPELLEACKGLLAIMADDIECTLKDCPMCKVSIPARNAVKKAEGL